ncbi:MAG: CcmD family protein [Chloroflexota bacterium]|nr:CcmD family protein [Chloroflexota bacterium]
MSEVGFLFAGFAVFWAGLFTYLVILQVRIRNLQNQVDILENTIDNPDEI